MGSSRSNTILVINPGSTSTKVGIYEIRRRAGGSCSGGSYADGSHTDESATTPVNGGVNGGGATNRSAEDGQANAGDTNDTAVTSDATSRMPGNRADRSETVLIDSAQIPANHEGGEAKRALRKKLSERLESLESFIKDIKSVACVAARGGMVKPVRSGSYYINDRLVEDLLECRYGEHASNLGAPIARLLARRYQCPAIIADPVGVDELEPLARYSGLAGIERRSFAHTLNIREVSRRAAIDTGIELSSCRFVVVHLGGGISVAAVRGGSIIDVNNSNEGGPFTPQRSGSLPVLQLVDLCYSGRFDGREDIHRHLTRSAGLFSYLGTDDVRAILERIEAGDTNAREVIDAMIYQIAKEIGATATVFAGRPDAIVVTGGFAVSAITDRLSSRIDWIAPVHIYPGELEMIALAEAARRVLEGEEAPQEY